MLIGVIWSVAFSAASCGEIDPLDCGRIPEEKNLLPWHIMLGYHQNPTTAELKKHSKAFKKLRQKGPWMMTNCFWSKSTKITAESTGSEHRKIKP